MACSESIQHHDEWGCNLDAIVCKRMDFEGKAYELCMDLD